MRTQSLNLIFFLILASSCASPKRELSHAEIQRNPSSAIRTCFTILKNFLATSKEERVSFQKRLPPPSALGPIYSKGLDEKPGQHIQFGFESEYAPEEAETLLKSYMPDPSMYSGSKEMWLQLSHQGRVQFLTENRKMIFPFRQKGKMIKITTHPDLQFALPDSIVFDVNNFEIILDPTDSQESLFLKIRLINQNLGVGSMQVMISTPINKSRLRSEKKYAKELKEELLGYYNFMNDFDTLTKLDTRYQNYLSSPEDLAIKSFHHPWLGPMTKLKHDWLKKLIDGIVSENPKIKHDLEDMSSIIESSKFIGGLAFRPDVAYKKGRIASEIRDCDKDLNCLEEKIEREIFFLTKGRELFGPYSRLTPFDSINDFNTKIPMGDAAILKILFPSYQGSREKVLELFRNFAYPYRDWTEHIERLGMPALRWQIKEAQDNYSFALREITLDYQMKLISLEQAQAKVIGELTKFAHKSGLATAFATKLKEMIDAIN